MYFSIFCPIQGRVSNPQRLTYTQILHARVLPYQVKSDKEYKQVEKEKGNISRSPQLAYNKLTEARGKEKKKKTIQ